MLYDIDESHNFHAAVVKNGLNKKEGNISCPIFKNTYIRKMLLNGLIQIQFILFLKQFSVI